MTVPETLIDNGQIDRNFKSVSDKATANTNAIKTNTTSIATNTAAIAANTASITANATVEALTVATLNANWSTGTSASAPSFYKDRGRVYLQGAAMRTTGATTTPFTLPANYRPTQTGGTGHIAYQFGGNPGVTISTAGVVTFSAVTNNVPIYLDGISFRI